MSDQEYFGHATTVSGKHIPLTESDARALLEATEKQAAARRERIPDTASALRLICDAKEILREQGWSDAIYCPKDGSLFAVVEWGSSGIFESFYMGEWPSGHLYVCDYLCHPSGLMWKAIDKLSQAEKAQLDKCMASERVSMERDIAFYATQQNP